MEAAQRAPAASRLSPELRDSMQRLVIERERAAYAQGWEDSRAGSFAALVAWLMTGAAVGAGICELIHRVL